MPEPALCWMRYFCPGPSARTAACSLQFASHIELMVSGKNVTLDLLLLVLLGNDVSSDDFKPTCSLPDLFPKVRSSMPEWIDRIAGCAIVTQIEGQERGLSTLQFRGHLDLAIADCKVNQRPTRKRKQRFWILPPGRWISVESELVDRSQASTSSGNKARARSYLLASPSAYSQPWSERCSHVTMMVMDFAKFTLIRWKDFGRCCDRGSGHTVVSRRKSYRTTSRFFNSSTTPGNEEKHSSNHSSSDYSLDLLETPYEPFANATVFRISSWPIQSTTRIRAFICSRR